MVVRRAVEPLGFGVRKEDEPVVRVPVELFVDWLVLPKGRKPRLRRVGIQELRKLRLAILDEAGALGPPSGADGRDETMKRSVLHGGWSSRSRKA